MTFEEWKRKSFPNTKAKDVWNYQQQNIDELKLKILKFIEDNVIEVDYDEYRFTGNFIDADKLKELLK